jgi:hypothetical protein
MRQRNPALGHHFHQITEAELELKIPSSAEDNDLSVKMAAFEKIINAQHISQLVHLLGRQFQHTQRPWRG